MDELGTLKIWITVRFIDVRRGECEKLVLVNSSWCMRGEAKELLRRFRQLNKELRPARAQWTMYEDLDLHEPVKAK